MGSYRESGSDTEDDWNLLCTGMCNDSSKQDFGDQFVPIFTIIATQLGQSKVRMR